MIPCYDFIEGATTLSITTFNIMTLSINVPQHNDTHGTQHKSVLSRYDDCRIFTAMLSVIMLGVVMLDVVMLGVVVPY